MRGEIESERELRDKDREIERAREESEKERQSERKRDWRSVGEIEKRKPEQLTSAVIIAVDRPA